MITYFNHSGEFLKIFLCDTLLQLLSSLDSWSDWNITLLFAKNSLSKSFSSDITYFNFRKYHHISSFQYLSSLWFEEKLLPKSAMSSLHLTLPLDIFWIFSKFCGGRRIPIHCKFLETHYFIHYRISILICLVSSFSDANPKFSASNLSMIYQRFLRQIQT